MTGDLDLYIGKRLRRRRRLLGLTQQQLADAIGVRFQQIQKYECAANALSASRLYDLSRCLEVDIRYFVEGFEASRPQAPARADPPRARRSFDPPTDARFEVEARP